VTAKHGSFVELPETLLFEVMVINKLADSKFVFPNTALGIIFNFMSRTGLEIQEYGHRDPSR
jgi:hypothetical protein